LPGTNALAYYENLQLTAVKSSISLLTGIFCQHSPQQQKTLSMAATIKQFTAGLEPVA
jgi:hypothetical protein